MSQLSVYLRDVTTECLPAQAVCERGGAAGGSVRLPVEGRTVAPGAERPEGGGGAGQVQADVPEGVDGGGHAAGRKGWSRRAVVSLTTRVGAKPLDYYAGPSS